MASGAQACSADSTLSKSAMSPGTISTSKGAAEIQVAGRRQIKTNHSVASPAQDLDDRECSPTGRASDEDSHRKGSIMDNDCRKCILLARAIPL